MLTTSVNKALVIVHMMFITHASFHDKCPQLPERCICIRNTDSNENTIRCSGIQNDMLQTAIKNASRYDLATIELTRSNIDDLHEQFFPSMSVYKLVLYFSHIGTFRAFDGLNSLRNVKNLHIEQTSVGKWIFAPALKLERMRTFSLLDCPEENSNDTQIVHYLPEKLTSITIRWCKFKSEDFSFQRFLNLKKLDLSNNLLTTVNRSHLPEYSWNLKFLSLSHNPISAIPKDMFTEMLSLETLDLESTSLTTFPHSIFYPVLQKVSSVQISGNPFNCDCFNAWLISERKIWRRLPKCNSPERLKGKEISSLTPKDMCEPEGEDYPESIYQYCRPKQGSDYH